ncbi:MAG: four helix bundle protein [Planctomycetota bacterium]
MRSYQDLNVWSEAVELTVGVYEFCRTLPADERFGLVTQMQRCAVSVPSNIAEGYGRASRQDFIRFLRIAQGSLKELETQLIICQRVHSLDNEQSGTLLSHTDRLGLMLRNMIRSLEGRTS